VPIVHYARNLLGMVGAKKRKELGADLRAIFAAPAREQALRIASSVANKWREQGHEKVAEHLEERVEECLSCLSLPESHRRRIRTTNGQERLKLQNFSDLTFFSHLLGGKFNGREARVL
jgi:transposase-like protein